MRSSAQDLARRLLQKADHDLVAARIGIEHEAPLDTVCFHIQQAAEKLLKAVLADCGIEYPHIHDLRVLLELAVVEYGELATFGHDLPGYTEFAVRLRYDDLPGLNPAEANEALMVVMRLRDLIHAALGDAR